MTDHRSAATENGEPAFQDLICDNHCYGCGPQYDRGLKIKSRWAGPAGFTLARSGAVTA